MRPPKFITDVCADLRDRKLLPLVAVLAVAIPAIPIALGADPASPPPPDAAVAEIEDLPTLPAVLAANPELRDYRERLDQLDAEDPFRFRQRGLETRSGSGTSGASIEEVSAASFADEAASSGGSTGGTSVTDSGASPSTSTSTATDTTVVEDTSGAGGGGGQNGGGGGSRPELVELAFRVDVEVGPAGDTKRRKNVKLMSVLPSQSNPVTLFLGASEDGQHAVFLVSEDVLTARGDGRCLPTPSDCQFLNMKKGDEMRFEYASGGGDADKFVLRILDIGLARNKDTADSDKREGGSPQADLRAFLGL